MPARCRRLLPLTAALVVTLGLPRPGAPSPAPDAGARPAPDAGASPAPAPAAAASEPFEPEIRAFEAADRIVGKRHARIVFIGSSSIRRWDQLGFDFPTHVVVNRGFGGSKIADSVRYAERILMPHRPPLVVMYAGSNDINGGSAPATVAADFQAFAAKVWEHFPDTAIAFISIAPSPSRWAQVDRVREANRLIAAYCATDKRLTFIDVFPRMLGADGRPRPELYVEDGLHMTRQGYLLWIPLIRGVLETVVPISKRAAGRHHPRP